MPPPPDPRNDRSPSGARVVVTGIGLVTGLGRAPGETWANLKAGRHAFRVLDLPATPGWPLLAGAPIARSDGDGDGSAVDLLIGAARAAYRDAQLPAPHAGGSDFDRGRAALVIGMSKGDLGRLSRLHRALVEKGPGADEELAGWMLAWPNAASSLLASEWDFRGPCLSPVAACATGLIAALQGAEMIRRGGCDLAIVGAGDASLDPLVLGAFRRMGVLARVGAGDDPGRCVRPWDEGRSGFLVGEGAAVLVLERDDHARDRGVRPYAELLGGAWGADAYHMTDLDPDPAGLAAVIARALAEARVAVAEIDHVNVHGTATRSNDPLECRAIRLALGPRADHVACSANKAQIGHLLGAAGAAELAITCMAIRDGFVPPTRNLTDPDPACDLDGTPHVGRTLSIGAALKLSIGFGGHLAAAVLRRVE